MERQLDFTLSPKFAGFPALINRMKADGMRVILILVCPSGRSLLGVRISFGGENFTHTVFPSMLCAEKLRVKRSSTVQVEGSAFPSEEFFSFLSPVILWLWFSHLTCVLIVGPSHFWKWDQELYCIHSRCGGWCLHQSSKWWRHCLGKGMIFTVTQVTGGSLLICLCLLFNLFHLGFEVRSSHFVNQYLSTQLRNF